MTNCECVAPGWCERHRLLKTDNLWYLCRTSAAYFALFESSEWAAPSAVYHAPRAACSHRGSEAVRLVTCDLCGSRGRLVSVFRCEVFGECTERRFTTHPERQKNVQSCLACTSYSSPTSDEQDEHAGTQ